jgi:DNA-binding transcriptional regulator YiaG
MKDVLSRIEQYKLANKLSERAVCRVLKIARQSLRNWNGGHFAMSPANQQAIKLRLNKLEGKKK